MSAAVPFSTASRDFLASPETLAVIRRDAEHELRVERCSSGVVLCVYSLMDGRWRPSSRFYIRVRHGEIPAVLEALASV